MTEPVKLGKPDSSDNYKRDLGWKVRDGQCVQHRFYVGKDQTAVLRRVERHEHLWAAIEAAWKEQRQSGVGSPLHLGDERPVWNTFTLVVAMAWPVGMPRSKSTPQPTRTSSTSSGTQPR